jgi:plasmid replication initiation protein
MKTNLTKQHYSRQSHFLINSKYTLTRGEIDLILTLLTVIKKEDKDFKDYIFDIEDLSNKYSKKLNSKQIQDTVENIFSKSLKIEVSQNQWKMFNWFSYFEYNNGIITCRFDKALKPYFLDIKDRFVISDLRMILPMRSSYSKRIYLLLKEYTKIGSRTFDVKELQDMLVVPDSYRERYNKFKISVLQKAETDINKFTDLDVSFTEKKLAKKIVKITYTIKKNKNDLKAFIKIIRELYINQILHYSEDNRAIKCNEKGYLYYDDNSYIDKKEAYKLWEYLHKNRENLYLFKKSELENIKYTYLANIDFFKEYLKEKFVHKKITQLKQDDMVLDISIFPNGRFYDMNGESIYDEDEVLRILYRLAQEDKLGIFM